MLINGGGAVALLAFIGTLWDNGIGRAAFLSLTCAISSFALGVLTGAIAAVCFFIQNLWTQADLILLVINAVDRFMKSQ